MPSRCCRRAAVRQPPPVRRNSSPRPRNRRRPPRPLPRGRPRPSRPKPRRSQAKATRRSTFGRSFNVAEVAGSAVDDGQERWLIQKDKLDFGPFSLVQIRAQIERGEILGEHMIVDSDTGARKKVKDFAPLAS